MHNYFSRSSKTLDTRTFGGTPIRVCWLERVGNVRYIKKQHKKTMTGHVTVIDNKKSMVEIQD